MTKYLLLHISGHLYFTSSKSKDSVLKEFSCATTSLSDLNQSLNAFCSQLNNNFDITLLSDTLIIQTVNLTEQTSAKNKGLLEQFISYELENSLDIYPDDPAVDYKKGAEGIYHCLLAEKSLLKKLKNTCQSFGGKLSLLSHPAGLLSSIKTGNNVEIYEQSIHCKTAKSHNNFTVNSSPLTDFGPIQNWLTEQGDENFNIYDFSNREVLPIEGKIHTCSIVELRIKDLRKSFKRLAKNSPAFNFKKSSQKLKKALPLFISTSLSIVVFALMIALNTFENSSLERALKKHKEKKTALENKQRNYLKKMAKIPELKKTITKFRAQSIILKNGVFWPELLSNLALAFDQKSQLKNISKGKDNQIIIEGITLDTIQVQKVADSLKANPQLKLELIDKTIKQNTAYEKNIWNFSLTLGRKSND